MNCVLCVIGKSTYGSCSGRGRRSCRSSRLCWMTHGSMHGRGVGGWKGERGEIRCCCAYRWGVVCMQCACCVYMLYACCMHVVCMLCACCACCVYICVHGNPCVFLVPAHHYVCWYLCVSYTPPLCDDGFMPTMMIMLTMMIMHTGSCRGV